ncbi:hypothetical protein CHRYSEOSP005_32860 [Chryseobacterium sp. Alg-005]|uniref:hypothetical protein n=1 Tax=Chryseobacterium sp. Alg-005 TaxID=3159516 RepID=UPI00355590B0
MSSVPVNEFYSESLAYDLNGNITHLSRNAPSFYSSNFKHIDNLYYNYEGNKLISMRLAIII